jgi:hypothetical protein
MHKTLIAALLIAAMGFSSVGAFAADADTSGSKPAKTEKKSKKAPKKSAKTDKTTTETK